MQFRHRSIECFATGIDYDGPLGIQSIELQANGLADAPLDAVTHDGFAERAGDGKSDMWSGRLGFAQTESGEQRTREAGPVVIDPAKVL